MYCEDYLFQFLIGRLGTITVAFVRSVVEEFQFLIGRLGTIRRSLDDSQYINVSIPYR